jgi:cyclohexanone monooxygenase
LNCFKRFHTSRWDYEYTGGDSTGGLRNLRNKRVAIIGTGATAVQVVPHLGENARQLYVFQRTPSSVDERNNRSTTSEFVNQFMRKPGWQKERMDNFTMYTQTFKPTDVDLINDGWTKIMKNLQQDFLKKRYKMMASGASREEIKALNGDMLLADLKQMHAVRMRALNIVTDKETAEALQPWYQQFCKRPCFHDEYLPTFNRPNVELVHDVGGIEAITEKGVVAKGKLYEVDCIVFATGFETGYNANNLGPQKIGYDIIGRNGQTLSEKWKDGPRTFWSFNTSGFPNLFMQNAPQGTFTTNFVQKLDEEALHAAHMITRLKAGGYSTFDPTKEAEDAYCAEIYRKSGRGQTFLQQCTPGYYNNEGKMELGKSLNSLWGTPLKFFKLLKKKRDEDEVFKGMKLMR